MWHDYKEGRWAVLPVASLWAILDYKSVANLPIRVSRILYLTLLISEINEIPFLRVVFIWAKGYPTTPDILLWSHFDNSVRLSGYFRVTEKLEWKNWTDQNSKNDIFDFSAMLTDRVGNDFSRRRRHLQHPRRRQHERRVLVHGWRQAERAGTI